MSGLTDTSWVNSEGNNVNADALKNALEDMIGAIRKRAPQDRVGIRAGDVVAIHPSMIRYLEAAIPEDENPIGFSREAGYLHKFSGIPVFQIDEVEPGIVEFGTYAAFCAKYPQWYLRQLEAAKALNEADLRAVAEHVMGLDGSFDYDGEPAPEDG